MFLRNWLFFFGRRCKSECYKQRCCVQYCGECQERERGEEDRSWTLALYSKGKATRHRVPPSLVHMYVNVGYKYIHTVSTIPPSVSWHLVKTTNLFLATKLLLLLSFSPTKPDLLQQLVRYPAHWKTCTNQFLSICGQTLKRSLLRSCELVGTISTLHWPLLTPLLETARGHFTLENVDVALWTKLPFFFFLFLHTQREREQGRHKRFYMLSSTPQCVWRQRY